MCAEGGRGRFGHRSEAPHCKVEGQGGSAGDGVQWDREEGVGEVERGVGGASGEEDSVSFIDHWTFRGEEVEDAVAKVEAEGARRDTVERDPLLVATATGGGEGVGEKAEEKTAGRRGEVRNVVKVGTDSCHKVGRREEEVVGEFLVHVVGGFCKEKVFKDRVVNGGAVDDVGRDQMAGKGVVAATPEVNGSSVAMVGDEEVVEEVNIWEVEVVEVGDDQGGTGGQEGDVITVEVFQGWEVEEDMGADEGGVGKGFAGERDNCIPQGGFNGEIEVGGEDEEQHVVTEEGDDEGVD